jgi:hypothetical protein
MWHFSSLEFAFAAIVLLLPFSLNLRRNEECWWPLLVHHCTCVLVLGLFVLARAVVLMRGED